MTAIATAESITALSRELGRADRDWALLAEGNTSVAVGNGLMLVKASGASMGTAQREDFVLAEIEAILELVDTAVGGDAEVSALFDAIAARSGGKRPSVEAILHAVCLDVPGINAVGHTHPTPVNSLLCSADAELLVAGSLFPDQIVVLGVNPLLMPYIDPGLRLARAARTSLREHIAATGLPPRVIYLRNHGMFALGSSEVEVLQITEMAVKVARVILGSLAAGGPVFLDAADVARIDTRPDELLRRAALNFSQIPMVPAVTKESD